MSENDSNGDDLDSENQVDAEEENFDMSDWSGHGGKDDRFRAISNLILRPANGCSGLTHPDFESCPELLTFITESCSILVVGAGGLGCELLKNLAMLGFGQLSVIDMDTIDLSNLNRQFLFRPGDIGRSKAECAAKFINNRIPHCRVEAYFNKIEDFDEAFYRKFRIVVCGLDSVVARRWMNGMIISMLSYDDDGNLDPSTVIPFVDGGTEGFKGNIRVVSPGISACLECSIDLYPPAVNYPMCTIAHTPRLPEHCVEYAKVFQWPKEEPFGGGVAVDGDDPEHITWIWKKAEDRAKEFGIQGVTYRLTLGVVKHIIPAVASTNAIIASACATEVLKLATCMYAPIDNFFSFNDVDGIYTNIFQMERNKECLACSLTPQTMYIRWTDPFRTLVDLLKNSPKYQMRSPGITALFEEKQRILYMANVASLEEQSRANLSKSFESLGLTDGQQILVADVTSPTGKIFVLRSVS